MRKILTMVLLSLLVLGLVLPGLSLANERVIRPLYILTRPQASSPDEFETVRLLVDAMRELGIDAHYRVMPWEQMADVVWFERDRWDATGWQMVARPERLDPDEFIYNLFHSSTAEDGYNFITYVNPEYDEVAEAQRVAVDVDERRELVLRAQEILAEDAVFNPTVHPMNSIVFNNQVFAEDSVQEMAGMGIRNFWTYTEIQPIGDQQDLVLNSNDTVQSINPFYISGTVDSWITELIWDRVMRMGKDGLPEPWAAKSVEWLDDTTIEIVLRDDMYWHDGHPVTVEDVKFSFEAPKTGQVPMYKPFVDVITAIDVVDDSTLHFHLERPWAAFETASLAKLNIVPKHIWEPIINDLLDSPENAETVQEDAPVGSGPFQFGAWRFAEEVVLEANPYHFSTPNVERWIVRFIPNMEAALGMIQNEEINFLAVYLGDTELLNQRVEADPKLSMVSTVDLGFRYVAFNHRRPPFGDAAFRRAMAAVTDRWLIVDAVWRGYAVPMDSIISPALEFWHHDGLDWPEGWMDEARAILTEAGYEWDASGRLLYPEGQVEELDPMF